MRFFLVKEQRLWYTVAGEGAAFFETLLHVLLPLREGYP